MKIALCTHLSLSYMGGGEREMCELANELTKRGHEVEFYSLPYTMGTKPKVDPRKVLDGVPYHEGWSHKIKTDVAYTFYHPLSTLNFRVQGKRIASFHSQAFFLKSVSPSYGLIPMAASYGTRLIGPLELRSFDAIHTHYPNPTIKHRKTYTIPGWVDTSVFKPTGPKSEQFTVLFSGRALWQKGWDIYVNLANRMQNLGIRFLYVGGAVRDEVIHSLGFQWNMTSLSQIYSDSHVLMAPVRADTFGKVAIESMACGTPVITTPSATHMGLGLPFVFGNSLSEYEESVLRMKELWERGRPYTQLSQKCVSAAGTFSFQKTVSEYERMFHEVASS
ncbi:MAG: glycosyltransferase family 4 protein [Thaumarchaeota archaeon]|nr:glycosyltransferase family 4 protein [Nitrososphaerota archaeon]